MYTFIKLFFKTNLLISLPNIQTQQWKVMHTRESTMFILENNWDYWKILSYWYLISAHTVWLYWKRTYMKIINHTKRLIQLPLWWCTLHDIHLIRFMNLIELKSDMLLEDRKPNNKTKQSKHVPNCCCIIVSYFHILQAFH